MSLTTYDYVANYHRGWFSKVRRHQVVLAERYQFVQLAVLETSTMAQPRVATDLGAEGVGHA